MWGASELPLNDEATSHLHPMRGALFIIESGHRCYFEYILLLFAGHFTFSDTFQ